MTLKTLNNNFNKINVFKPPSSKKKSNEIYLICIEFKDWYSNNRVNRLTKTRLEIRMILK